MARVNINPYYFIIFAVHFQATTRLHGSIFCVGMKIRRTWTTKHWCDSVVEPEWPFAYTKYKGQKEESKGRVSSNRQDVRHICETQGVQSKCHICEDIKCGSDLTKDCHFQLQGVSWEDISRNIPTISDVPWAVGGSYRYDFGGINTTHVCMHMSGSRPCQSHSGEDYGGCTLRCWGYLEGLSRVGNKAGLASNVQSGGIETSRTNTSGVWPNLELSEILGGLNSTPWLLSQPTALWSYPKSDYNDTVFTSTIGKITDILPQGFTFTLAGSDGEEGFVDGFGSQARFRNPEGLAVDHEGYVYVADTGNHAIRMISPSGRVSTIAGTGEPGYLDGTDKNDTKFSSPSGIAIWRDWKFEKDGRIVIFVADTGNHRIRKITGEMYLEAGSEEKKMKNTIVQCYAGFCGKSPQAGFSDGSKSQSRFDTPIGIITSNNGNCFITDVNNHLVRMINTDGKTVTLAGELVLAEINEDGKQLEGCPDPCLTGFQGHKDGAVNEARFSFPIGVALTPDETSLLVTSRHYLRRINILEQTVQTIAGGNRENEQDGQGFEASFNKPAGITVTNDGYAYLVDSSSCRIRRIGSPNLFVPTIECDDTLGHIFRPSGCFSYDSRIDQHGFKVSPQTGNIYYNYLHRNLTHLELGANFVGRSIKDCVGAPPRENLDKLMWNESTLVVDDDNISIREDPNEGSLVQVACTSRCSNDTTVYGFKQPFDKRSGINEYYYTTISPICTAAAHAGLLNNDGNKSLLDVTIHRPEYNNSTIFFAYSGATGEQIIQSVFKTSQFFSLRATVTAEVSVQTIAGAPSALRGESCGSLDAIPALESKFRIPAAIAAFVNNTLDDKRDFLFVADRNNHLIRGLSAVCTFPCENGGRCIGPDTCDCKSGWIGFDCTQPTCSNDCGKRRLCVAPDTCSCIPGYLGENCDKATCVQTCENSGLCIAPDTCSCKVGWFDSNCTTPVCSHTCGNGGNCTGPDQCNCPMDWTGSDCREPVCEQNCMNGGWCIAPNTCMCPPDWSGYNCREPVCHQGYFEAQSSELINNIPKDWVEFKPCEFEQWCNHTKNFDCSQRNRVTNVIHQLYGHYWRFKTGKKLQTEKCFLIELRADIVSPFQYIKSFDNNTTSFQRYTDITPNDWFSEQPQDWNALVEPHHNHTSPWTFKLDRQVALVELRNVIQGSYKCANQGKCVGPDTCACPDGWIGFDCRTPVCTQGYFEPNQKRYVSGVNDEYELNKFQHFLDKNKSYRLDPEGEGYSNPDFFVVQERYVNSSFVERKNVLQGGKPYKTLNGDKQGGYACSIRSVTKWEDYRTGKIFEHPNYYSRYMDSKDDKDYSQFWDDMGWDPIFKRTEELVFGDLVSHSNNSDPKRRFVYTDRGYMKDGQWIRTNATWFKGYCIVEFRRACGERKQVVDLAETNIQHQHFFVQDTDLSFRPRINFDNNKATRVGEWKDTDSECIDQVIRGCYNNGTCVGPNQCACEQGWTGSDCSIPECEHSCKNNGNCTLPNVCTCEMGWKGYDCSIPLCAQNCNNGGICVAPDTCRCFQWENIWRDGRVHGGFPLYQTPTGDPQLTGWTGYDCSTPICVQAEHFVLNINLNSYVLSELISLGGHGNDGTLRCDQVECPQFNEIVTINNGESFQSGCGFDPIVTGCCYEKEDGSLQCLKCDPSFIRSTAHSLHCTDGRIDSFNFDSHQEVSELFKESRSQTVKLCGPRHNPMPVINSFSVSPSFLCKRFEWEQGNFIDKNQILDGRSNHLGRHIRVNYKKYVRDKDDPYIWTEGEGTPGEGLFACYNRGSCIAPDVCTCRDGYTGFDCQTPMCRHQQADGKVVGCLNGGICVGKDNCVCDHIESSLWLQHQGVDREMTGWGGSDCSMPICVQGYYDPECTDNLFSIGGQGCHRCHNGGLCVAPDVCRCAEGWTGYDCKTPICMVAATELIRKQLRTVDEEKIKMFEADPCEMKGFYDGNALASQEYRGICTLPNQCTCHCKGSYDKQLCQVLGGGIYCKVPFHDRLHRFRKVLAQNQLFGTRSCYSGYEGAVNKNDQFTSCHMEIYEPSYLVKNSISLMFWSTFILLSSIAIFIRCRVVLHRRFIQEKIQNRKIKRSTLISSNSHAFSFDNNNKIKEI